jgi:digeranylgeranylglycerophospholipid reductase
MVAFMTHPQAVVAGAGPAGLAAAEALARRGRSVLVLEQNHEVGSPIRTSGGSFIDELEVLGIPDRLYHPISRVIFRSAANEASFDYPKPSLCVIDVRGVFQFLAERAAAAGASLRLATPAVAPILQNGRVEGVRTRDSEIPCRVLIDATGYRSTLLKQAGLGPGFRRFGVGAEYDLYAPAWDAREVLLAVGSVAPSGYAWIFPWGRNRVRAGVGIIHPDSAASPDLFLDRFVASIPALRGAQPIEHHSGLIPSEQYAAHFSGDGILGAGDAAGHASSLLGEGIRWAIQAGKMAGEIAADALDRDDVSRASLVRFDAAWRARFGVNLRLAHKINRRIAQWDDRKWDERLEIVKLLSPEQLVEALKSNLTGRWLWKFLASNPLALAAAARLRGISGTI